MLQRISNERGRRMLGQKSSLKYQNNNNVRDVWEGPEGRTTSGWWNTAEIRQIIKESNEGKTPMKRGSRNPNVCPWNLSP